jgi:hypothetical protein
MDLSVMAAALLSGTAAGLFGVARVRLERRARARARAAGLPLGRHPGRMGSGQRSSGWSNRRRWRSPSGRPVFASLPPRAVRAVTSLLLGVGLALTVTGFAGLVLGVLAGAAGYRWLPDPPSPEQRRERRVSGALRDQVPLTADLLAGCLSSWCAPVEAAEAVAQALGEPMASRLARVAAEIRTGADAEESWGRFGADPVLGPLGRCLVRAGASGAPPAEGLARLAQGARTASATAAQGRVRRAGVLAAAPLGLCFLPAFVLVGVVPVVTGLAGSFLVRI